MPRNEHEKFDQNLDLMQCRNDYYNISETFIQSKHSFVIIRESSSIIQIFSVVLILSVYYVIHTFNYHSPNVHYETQNLHLIYLFHV